MPFITSPLFSFCICLVLQGWKLFSAMDSADVVCDKNSPEMVLECTEQPGEEELPKAPQDQSHNSPQETAQSSCRYFIFSSYRYFIFSSYPVQNSLMMMCSCQGNPPCAQEWVLDSLKQSPPRIPGFYPSKRGWRMEMFIIIYFHALVRTRLWGPHVNSHRKQI